MALIWGYRWSSMLDGQSSNQTLGGRTHTEWIAGRPTQGRKLLSLFDYICAQCHYDFYWHSKLLDFAHSLLVPGRCQVQSGWRLQWPVCELFSISVLKSSSCSFPWTKFSSLRQRTRKGSALVATSGINQGLNLTKPFSSVGPVPCFERSIPIKITLFNLKVQLLPFKVRS